MCMCAKGARCAIGFARNVACYVLLCLFKIRESFVCGCRREFDIPPRPTAARAACLAEGGATRLRLSSQAVFECTHSALLDCRACLAMGSSRDLSA